jgi:hypothetical protein
MDEQKAVKSDVLASDTPSEPAAVDVSPLQSMALHKPAIAVAVSLGILPVLYRIGFIGSLVIVVLAV